MMLLMDAHVLMKTPAAIGFLALGLWMLVLLLGLMLLHVPKDWAYGSTALVLLVGVVAVLVRLTFVKSET